MNKTYCFFSARYLPYLGGVERYTYNLAKELVSKGNKVIIVTSLIGEESVYEEKDEGIVIRIPSLKLLNGRFPVARYNKLAKELLNKLHNFSVDFIVINTRFYLLSYVGARFAKKARIPAIVIEHGTGHFTVNSKVFDCAGHFYEHFISNMVKRCVGNYYGVSLECNKWLEHFGITAKGVLYNAIDPNEIEKLSKKESLIIESKIEFDSHDIIITFTGRLIQEKGILKLIKAFGKVKEKYKNVKLCIAGDGDLYDEIISEDYGGVYLLGKLSFQDVISLLKRTTIFCLPTDYPEGLPTSILEAIACKSFVITTKAGGAKEVITDESYGIIMERNDSQEIEEKLILAIENEEMRKSAIEKAYHKVLSEFTWSSTACELMDAFEKMNEEG